MNGIPCLQDQEVLVNHFGIAFGVITASVIGGALFFNHKYKDAEIAEPAAVKTATDAQPAPAASAAAPSDAAPTAATPETRESPVKMADAGPASAPPSRSSTKASKAPPERTKSGSTSASKLAATEKSA